MSNKSLCEGCRKIFWPKSDHETLCPACRTDDRLGPREREEETRICLRCHEPKPLSEFGDIVEEHLVSKAVNPSGKRYTCKSCEERSNTSGRRKKHKPEPSQQIKF